MLADKEVVKQLTIEQKIDFWRRVMQYANDRNIEFYVDHVEHLHLRRRRQVRHHRRASTIRQTIDYFRASVREMFRTYPLLRGIGLTAGENMGDASAYYSGGTDSFDAKENWLFATYGQGVLDAARAEPQRQFRLIHRQHESRAQDIATTFKPVIAQPNVDFVFSFKYAQAHALSSTTQTFHRGYLESLGDLQDALDAAQRRRVDVPLGRAGFRARVRQEHSVREIAGLLPRLGHVGVGPGIPGARSASCTRQLEDRQALAALPAVGPARLRPDARQRAHRGAGRHSAFPASTREACSPPGRTRR